MRELIFVDDDGRRVASMRTRQSEDREVEVARADLSAILVEAGRGDAEFLFDEMITELHLDDGGVDVIFDRAAHAGLTWWSAPMASTPESAAWPSTGSRLRRASRDAAATATLGVPLERDDMVIMHNEPGTAVALHPGTGVSGVAFMFRSEVRIDHRDPDAPAAAAAGICQRRRAHGGTAVCLSW